MVDRYKDRLKILDDQEMYGRPQFNHDERLHFFSLSSEERALADTHYNLANRALFILQLGYFKARTLFFSFEFEEVQEDVRHVLQRHYYRSDDTPLVAPSLKQTRYGQQRKILDLCGYRACTGKERAALEQQVIAFQQEGNDSGERISQILSLFIDDSIADSVSFGEVKQRAFGILERDKFPRAVQYIGAHSFDTVAIEWEFIASFAPSFKQHLRPLLLQLPFAAHGENDCLMEAVSFLRECFDKGKSLTRSSFDQMPKAFIPQGVKPYLYQKHKDGNRSIHADKYEFLVYRLLRNRLEAGDIYVGDSLRFRSFEEDLIPKDTWKRDQLKILQDIDAPLLSQPMAEVLNRMEEELEAKYEEVNRRILSGENEHVKLSTSKSGEISWTLPYVGDEETVNNQFFDEVPQLHIAQLLQFVDSRCQCLDAFTHILQRYVKTPLDRHAVVACVIA
jgi:hypothetical protein